MNFLANTDAVIIDLRRNPGGFINLEIFLASYFYGVDTVELLSRYHREGDVTVIPVMAERLRCAVEATRGPRTRSTRLTSRPVKSR